MLSNCFVAACLVRLMSVSVSSSMFPNSIEVCRYSYCVRLHWVLVEFTDIMEAWHCRISQMLCTSVQVFYTSLRLKRLVDIFMVASLNTDIAVLVVLSAQKRGIYLISSTLLFWISVRVCFYYADKYWRSDPDYRTQRSF